ncbi:hypothetical protein FQN60_012242 [Etheostoma spectabile]|uniref:Uncharacterized protein n=1 Tax=Etheostoma spectabile TaxID=54343 RepID=A0A5J5DNP9_9PERO|nr:hypothetical protein FQN60_012242 [Etheostoma spectabile]
MSRTTIETVSERLCESESLEKLLRTDSISGFTCHFTATGSPGMRGQDTGYTGVAGPAAFRCSGLWSHNVKPSLSVTMAMQVVIPPAVSVFLSAVLSLLSLALLLVLCVIRKKRRMEGTYRPSAEEKKQTRSAGSEKPGLPLPFRVKNETLRPRRSGWSLNIPAVQAATAADGQRQALLAGVGLKTALGKTTANSWLSGPNRSRLRVPYRRPRSWELRELRVSKISPSRSISSGSHSKESSPSSLSFWSSESSTTGPDTALMHKDDKQEWHKQENTCCFLSPIPCVSRVLHVLLVSGNPKFVSRPTGTCASEYEARGLTFVSGYGAGCFKEPVEGPLWVFSDRKEIHSTDATSSSPSSSNSPSSAVASWYCWYSDTKSFMLLSASVNSISSMPSPVYQWRKALRRNMAVNCSEMRLNSSWMAVLLPMKVAAILSPRGGMSHTAVLTLLGIHSTK